MVLNENQKEAAEFTHGIAVVVAVPGSGKTLTMTERIGILVNKHGIAPENILGVTFTRNAAHSMKSRLRPVLNSMASRVMISTIHSFCYSLLRNEKRVFEILSPLEQLKFIKKVMNQLKFKDLPAGLVLREISLAKNNLISVEEFSPLHEDGNKTMMKIAEIYETYEQQKNNQMLMDFDDLLVEAYHLLNSNEKVLRKYQDVYQHLLVDEFQDISPAQMEVLKTLISDSDESSFWACGDDWQSIYSFTGASVRNILNFKEIFPQSEEFILNINYRSSPQILRACQNLIKHNVRKVEKTLEAFKSDGHDVVILDCSSEDDEALQIVNEITYLVQNRNYDYTDMALLYRANFQSRVIEEVFSQHKIPYRIENGLSFYDRREVKGLVDYLRLIHSPDSDEGIEALKAVFNIPNRYISKKFIKELEQFSVQNNLPLYQSLKSMDITVPYIQRNIKDLIEFIDPLIMDAKEMKPGEVIQIVRESLDYDSYIVDDDIPSPDDAKILNIEQLQMAASKYNDSESFLKHVDTFQGESKNDSDGVSLMTIHKAKGLEFSVVFVIGMVEGILPSKQGDIEEERRVAFVALSRAKEMLYLSAPISYTGKPHKKSTFLSEITE